MVTFRLDDYPQILNTRHINHHDGAPVLFEHRRELYVYFGGFRDWPWDPIKMFANSSGVYAFYLKKGSNFSKPTNLIENSIVMGMVMVDIHYRFLGRLLMKMVQSLIIYIILYLYLSTITKFLL